MEMYNSNRLIDMDFKSSVGYTERCVKEIIEELKNGNDSIKQAILKDSSNRFRCIKIDLDNGILGSIDRVGGSHLTISKYNGSIHADVYCDEIAIGNSYKLIPAG